MTSPSLVQIVVCKERCQNVFLHYFIHETHRLCFIFFVPFVRTPLFCNFIFLFSPLIIFPVISFFFFFFFYGSLLISSYFFFGKMCEIEVSSLFFRFCSSTLLDLPLFIYSYSLSYHGPILLTTRLPITNSLLLPSLLRSQRSSPPTCRMLL